MMTVTASRLLKNAAQAASVLALLTIAVLSLVPGTMRPSTGSPKEAEHFAAYAITAALLALGFGQSLSLPAAALCMAVYSAALELAQGFIPGRQCSIYDLIGSTGGAFAGFFLARMASSALPKP